MSKFIGSFWLAGRHPRNPVGILQVKTGESDPRQYPYAGYRRELFTPLPPYWGDTTPVNTHPQTVLPHWVCVLF